MTHAINFTDFFLNCYSILEFYFYKLNLGTDTSKIIPSIINIHISMINWHGCMSIAFRQQYSNHHFS